MAIGDLEGEASRGARAVRRDPPARGLAGPRTFGGRDDLHRRLCRLNQRRLRPALDAGFSSAALASETADRRLEETFVDAERAAIRATEDLDAVPADPEGFVTWFEHLAETGPGQGDALFPFLAERASLEQVRWFLAQEVAGEAGFDELLALTQLGMPTQAKLEMARNYWDELGRGRASAVHGAMLEALADAMGARLPIEEIVWPSLALSNLMVALAWNRHYAYQSVGALGVIELTAPGRARLVDSGMRRVGVPASVRRYFALHAEIDLRHSSAWNRQVLRTLVQAEPRCARAIAEGALLRLRAGARCFAAYRQRLGVIA